MGQEITPSAFQPPPPNKELGVNEGGRVWKGGWEEAEERNPDGECHGRDPYDPKAQP